MRAPAYIHVDTDGSWAIKRHFGLPIPPVEARDVVFDTGLSRLEALFQRLGLPATWFVIGRDLDNPDRRAFFERVAGQGHELANHTETHPEGFAGLGPEEKHREIATCGARIAALTGRPCVGFRAPNFELTPNTVPVLEALGYRYDSSVLPTALGPPLRWYHRARTGGRGSAGYLGQPGQARAPLGPYHLDAKQLSRRGLSPVLELPVAVLPGPRAPIHGSYLRVYELAGVARALFRRAVTLYAARGLPFVFLLHASDLADPEREPDIAGEIGNSWTAEQRVSLFQECLEFLAQNLQIRPTVPA